MAITVTNNMLTVMGDRVVGVATLTKDGTATTVNLPTGKIDVAFPLNKIGTVATLTTGTSLSWSGKTLTLSRAGTNADTLAVFWVGSA